MAESAPTTPQAKPATLWAAVASLVAMESLFVVEPRFMGLHLLAGLIALTGLVRFRLPNNPLVTWPIRLLLLAAVFISQSGRTLRGSPWMLDPSYVNLFGYLCAAELVVQFWVRRKSAHGEILMMSAMVFAAASATYDRRFIPMVAPAYVILLAMSMREFRWRAAKVVAQQSRSRRIAVWGLVLASTLGIGFAGATVLREYGEKVTIHPFGGLFKNLNNPFEAAGLSTYPRLTGSIGNQQTTRRVLRIEGSWSGGHVRAMSFDNYAEGGWSAGYARSYSPVSRRELDADAPGRRIRVTRLIDQLNLVFAPLNSAGISVGVNSQASWDRDHIVQLWTPDGEPSSEPYEVVLGKRDDSQGPLCARLMPGDGDRFLAVPEKIQQPLKQILSKTGATGQSDPKKRIAAIARYLMDNHGYSLSMKTGGGDPVVDFLVNKRDGYCQYFGSAMVLLARTAGVPARFVTGYYAHECVGDGVTIVRQRDAHAWAEVWLDGIGWVTVDATPANGRPDQNAAQPGWWQKFKEWSEDKWAAFKQWLASLGWVRIAVGFGLAAAAVAMLKGLWGLLKQWRPRKRPGESWYGDGDLGAIARMFDQLLKGSGAACSPSCTWTEHLESMRRQGARGINIEIAAAFVTKYQQARFGTEPYEAAAKQLHEMLERL